MGESDEFNYHVNKSRIRSSSLIIDVVRVIQFCLNINMIWMMTANQSSIVRELKMKRSVIVIIAQGHRYYFNYVLCVLKLRIKIIRVTLQLIIIILHDQSPIKSPSHHDLCI